MRRRMHLKCIRLRLVKGLAYEQNKPQEYECIGRPSGDRFSATKIEDL